MGRERSALSREKLSQVKAFRLMKGSIEMSKGMEINFSSSSFSDHRCAESENVGKASKFPPFLYNITQVDVRRQCDLVTRKFRI